ncbi:MAG TPA: PilC/PilY family type IV pilus protein [Nitrospira sp.]|mgnify:CR=1 FL=1|nr:PilC/PilY family type IV pilus protein [Nitrospira sp.]
MHNTQFRKRLLAHLVAALHIATGSVSYAATTDLSDTPLANVSGTASVKPNIMFLLDDSGSMMQQYTPDYISERWGGPAASDRHCYDSLDDTDSNRDLCIFGDPPYMSPDFNKQYYSPEISYSPPVDDLGNAYQSQTAANTSNWTAVKTDGFNTQNINHFEQSFATWNIASQFPNRAWCQNQGDNPNSPANNPLCVTNSSGYFYPDATYNRGQDGTVNFNSSGGTGSTVTHAKFRYGNPYYYRILPGEYCADEALTNCETVPLGGSPVNPLSIYPAKVRWCTSETNALAVVPAAGSCQGKKVGSFQYARFSFTAPASKAYGTILIGDSTTNDSVTITEVKVNGVTVMNSIVTAGGGTNSSGERSTFATALASAINAYHVAGAGTNYAACTTATTITCATILGAGAAIPAGTVAIIPTVTPGGVDYVTDASRAGESITVTAPANNITPSSGRISVLSAGTGGSITALTINGVSAITAPISFTINGSGTTARDNAATAIRNAINTFPNATPWEYTARSRNQNVSPWGTCPNNAGQVCVDAPLSAGNLPNTYVIGITAAGGASVNTTAFSGGVSRFVPTTTTSINAGAASTTTFQRIDIAPATATYPRAGTRVDCATTPGVCTYDEEMTNFANWYAYYRTRMQMMKTSVGQAFIPLNNAYRLGFTTINNSSFSGTSGSRWLALADLDATQKQTWYSKLYAQSPSGSTPLRNALDRIGQLYEGTLSGAPDPIQASCQQNFTILTTDGYWNQSFTGYGNQDNVDPPGDGLTDPFCNRATGCYDGNLSGGSATNSLADVALYYYKRDLRPTMTNDVPASSRDPNTAQHMTTFTIGLGVDGVMTFQENYESAASGDFYWIKTGSAATTQRCNWQSAGSTCNWPVPVGDTETAVDDLWHAAVNGHGTYFSAKDPASMARGLANALASLKVRNAAAAASATSTPNVTQDDNDIFSATFRTVKWDGELVAQKINTVTGELEPTITWSMQSLLDAKVDNSSDTRTIYTLDASGSTPARKTFTWGNLVSAEQNFLSNKCIGTPQLSQCSTFDASQKTLANNGENMLNYLRGQRAMEITVPPLYRDREHALGDIANAKPAYVRNPRRAYGDTGYNAYKSAQEARQAMVYVAANDGMLHALNATTGDEVWAYLPRIILPELYRLADSNYQNNHRFFVDGTPESGDVYINSDWRTILVGGFNKGGRGYYALDVTEPSNPVVLWEICSDASLCQKSDADIGYTYGNPVIAKRPTDGKWVVMFASGYNNVSPGDGKGYLYVVDATDGTILNKIGTGVGSTTTPSGLAKITARAEFAQTNNIADAVFGGDLLGNMWRFDLTTNSVIKLASLTDYLGAAQPITSRPDVGKCETNYMVYVGTGKYLGLSDLSDTQRQTMYGIKDTATAIGTFRGSTAVQQSFFPLGGGGYTITNNPVSLSTVDGWYVDFDQNSGERVNLDPALVFGNLLVVTNQPTNISACTTGGVSYLYEFDYCKGSYLLAAPSQRIGGQLGNSIVVGFIVIRLPSGALKVVTTFAGGEKTTGAVTSSVTGKVRRVSWRELTE